VLIQVAVGRLPRSIQSFSSHNPRDSGKTSNAIRSEFLSYFERNGHKILASDSLIPSNDSSLLFTNAGAYPTSFPADPIHRDGTIQGVFSWNLQTPRQVKLCNHIDCFAAGFEQITTCQKCIRVKGKHDDLENVGRTARHHTFFEMLGNFSFGKYGKEEAIKFAWEFLTATLALPRNRLRVTVFESDMESLELWKQAVFTLSAANFHS
jgi:alanyl-tRNA synthetase